MATKPIKGVGKDGQCYVTSRRELYSDFNKTKTENLGIVTQRGL